MKRKNWCPKGFFFVVHNSFLHVQGNVLGINFCQSCGGATKHEIPDGEEKMRAICTLCGKISYQNPKMVCKDDVLLLPNLC